MATSSALAVVLLTDMVDSTATRVRLGAAFNRLLREHDQMISDVLARHGPTRRTDTGDGFRATFDSATAAIDAACAIQWGVQERNEAVPAGHRFEVRIVLSAGELVFRAGKLHGMALVEAARLEKKAGAGEIRCTDVLRLLASEEDPALFVDPEDVPFKGFGESRRVWRIAWEMVPPAPAELPLPGPLASRPQDVFVGRAVERARVIRNWEQAQRTGNRLVVVWGEAGIGKSALARAVAQDLHQQRAWVLYGRCDREPVTPFQPFTEALSTFIRDSGGSRQLLGRGHAHLLALVAGPGSGSGWSSGAASDPETTRYELFAAVADWLATISRDNGVLFVLDDLDLADDPTLELVRHVVRAASTGNVCLLATCRWSTHPRDAPGGGVLHDLVRLDEQIEDVSLRGFGDVEVQEVVANRVGRGLPVGPGTAAFVHELCTFTDGNPLFVQAVLADIPDDVVDRLRVGGLEPIHLGVPEDVQELFRKRRRRLSAPARAVLDVASVVGSAFPDELVAEAAGLERPEAAGALAELRRSGLVRAGRADGHQFAHALIHEAARRNLGAAEQVELHLRVAHALEQGDDPLAMAAELSQHYAASPTELHRRASADYAVIAGDRAAASSAAGLAARHYRHALTMFDGLTQGLRDADRCDLVAKLGLTLKQAGDPRATPTLLEAARLANELGEAPRMARAALATLSEAWRVTGAVDEATVEVLERAVVAVGDDLPALRARLLAALAAELSFSGDRARVEALNQEALDLARSVHDAPPPAGDRSVLARVLEHRHTVLLHPDGLHERRRIVAELDELSAAGGPTRSFTAASYGFWTAMELGDTTECRRRVQTMREIVETVNTSRFVALTMHWQSALTALLGQIDDAEAAAREAADLWSSLGTRDAVAFGVGLRYLPAWYRGRLGDVVADLEASAAAHRGRVGMRAGRAHAWSVIGQRERALAALDDVDLESTVGHHDQLVALALTTMAARNLGELDRLRQARKLLAPYEDHVLFNGTACFGSAQQYLALACGATDEFDEADARFHAAAERHTTMAAPALLAATKLEWGAMLLRRRAPSDGVRSRVLLEESLTIAHGLGLSALEQASHRLLATESQGAIDGAVVNASNG